MFKVVVGLRTRLDVARDMPLRLSAKREMGILSNQSGRQDRFEAVFL